MVDPFCHRKSPLDQQCFWYAPTILKQCNASNTWVKFLQSGKLISQLLVEKPYDVIMGTNNQRGYYLLRQTQRRNNVKRRSGDLHPILLFNRRVTTYDALGPLWLTVLRCCFKIHGKKRHNGRMSLRTNYFSCSVKVRFTDLRDEIGVLKKWIIRLLERDIIL